jgi:hypothetical protein
MSNVVPHRHSFIMIAPRPKQQRHLLWATARLQGAQALALFRNMQRNAQPQPVTCLLLLLLLGVQTSLDPLYWSSRDFFPIAMLSSCLWVTTLIKFIGSHYSSINASSERLCKPYIQIVVRLPPPPVDKMKLRLATSAFSWQLVPSASDIPAAHSKANSWSSVLTRTGSGKTS